MSQVKSVITLHGGKVVEKHILDLIKLVKIQFQRIEKSLSNF